MNNIIDLQVFAKRLSNLIDNSEETTYSLANKLGLTPATISRYANALMKPKVPTVVSMAKIFNVNDAWLMGYDVPMQVNNNINLKSPEITSDTVTFPVIGEIAAGYDEIAVEDWYGETVEIPTAYLKGRKKEDFFVLSVHGNSMYPLYMNGDKVLILKQSTLNNSGDIGAILYDGDIATLKKVEYVMGEDWLRLVPINPEYQPKKIEGADLEMCRVIGIPRLLIREIEE